MRENTQTMRYFSPWNQLSLPLFLLFRHRSFNQSDDPFFMTNIKVKRENTDSTITCEIILSLCAGIFHALQKNMAHPLINKLFIPYYERNYVRTIQTCSPAGWIRSFSHVPAKWSNLFTCICFDALLGALITCTLFHNPLVGLPIIWGSNT